MKKIKLIYSLSLTLIMGMVALTEGCSSDLTDNGLSPKGTLDAAFSVTPITASPNKFVLTANNENYIFSQWDLGDGSGYVKGDNSFTAFFPDAGTYKVQHRVVGAGGIVSSATSQTVVIATSDPNAGNLIKGGKFSSAADIAQWTIANPSSSATWAFSNGKATLTATGSNGNGIYQAISVVKDKSYKINMLASSTSGCVDTWFEVYCGYNAPVAGTDYSEGGKLFSINTWDGSGKTPFSGKISTIGTVAADNKGIFTATKTGTVYLMIRGGGGDMKSGISITNIEFRGITQ